MIMDNELTLSDQQNLAQAIGSYLSTNSVNLLSTGTIPGIGGTPISDPGRGNRKSLLVQVTETFTSGGGGTLLVNLVSGTGVDANGQINAGKKIHNSSRAYALADLKAGKQIEIGLHPGFDQQYLAVEYVIAGAAMTAGKVTAAFVADRQTNPSV